MATGLADQIAAKGSSPVAVTSFTNPDYGPAFSVFLVDRLNVLLVSSAKQFEVVTRDRIEDAFREINLALGKNYDAATFSKVGKAVGAKSLIRGSFAVMAAAAKVSVTVQILDVQTGRIIGGALADLPYTGDIKTMLTPLEGGGPASGPDAADSSIRTVQQIEVNRFLFRLRQCSASRTAVTCKLTVTSPEQDRTIRFGSYNGVHSSLFDQAGNEYELTHVMVGNKNGRSVDTLLVRDVPVQAELTFNVTGNVTTISLLKIRGSGGNAFLDIQFRNIRPQ